MSENVKPVLEKALELIRDPEHWCKEEEAQYLDGTGADPTDPEAVRFCMVGSIRRASWDVETEYAGEPAMRALRPFLPQPPCQVHPKGRCYCAIPEFNDDPNTTHEDVVLVFKHAIHALEGLDV